MQSEDLTLTEKNSTSCPLGNTAFVQINDLIILSVLLSVHHCALSHFICDSMSSSLETMRFLRDQPPSHYLWKLKPFSLLVKSEIEKHESGAFQGGGYKWKLVLYPNGDQKADGKDHVSLYLAIQETASLPKGWEVNVELKLFLFDHLKNKYLVVQDGDGGVKNFHEMKTELGFAKLIPLQTLNDPGSGYLVDDSCVFGAEVFVIQLTGKCDSILMNEDQKKGIFSSKLMNFSELPNARVHPNVHNAGCRNGKMILDDSKVYDKGEESSLSTLQRLKNSLFSVFQRQSDCNSLSSDEELDLAEARLEESDMSSCYVAGISRTIRDLPPAHYLFEIKSFSSLLKQEGEKHESDSFEAGGFKWRLSLYPNGCKDRNGNGHISLYLRILETKTFSPNWEINVNFKLFVLDQIRDKYLTIQDADGTVRRFYEMKTEWGFDQLVPVETFNDDSNGYLINDRCIFGAEVFVIRHTCVKDSISVVKNPATCNTYTWKIDKFSTLTDEFYDSEDFTICGRKWRLDIYPKGYGTAKNTWLSLYVYLVDGKSLPLKQEWHVEFKLRVRDQVNGNHLERSSKKCYKYPFIDAWGYGEMMLLKDLGDASKGYIRNDTVIVEVIFTSLAVREVLLET